MRTMKAFRASCVILQSFECVVSTTVILDTMVWNEMLKRLVFY